MSGLKLFYFVLIGQSVSILGSSLTNFGVSVWILQEYAGSEVQTTLYTLTLLASTLPAVLLGPFIGSLVDRWPRKANLIGSQLGSAICTLIIAGFYWFDQLSVWALLWVLPLSSICGVSLQVGFTASVALVVPKDDLSRASGAMGLMFGVVQLIGPLLAGILMDQIGLDWIFVIDLATFTVGLLTLFIVAIPNPKQKAEGKVSISALVMDLVDAYQYMRSKKGVLGGLFLFSLIWFNVSAVQALFAPLVLSMGNATDLGFVQMLGGLGLLVGSIFMVAWKGPDRKMLAILGAAIVIAMLLVVTPIPESVWLIGLGAFLIMAIAPIANTSSQVMWQKKTDPAYQGRVFSLRNTMMKAAQPIAFLSAGVFADGFFKPQMKEGMWLADLLGPIWGVGEPRGIALMISFFGMVSFVFVVIAWLMPSIRLGDINLPDFDEEATSHKKAQLDQSGS